MIQKDLIFISRLPPPLSKPNSAHAMYESELVYGRRWWREKFQKLIKGSPRRGEEIWKRKGKYGKNKFMTLGGSGAGEKGAGAKFFPISRIVFIGFIPST